MIWLLSSHLNLTLSSLATLPNQPGHSETAWARARKNKKTRRSAGLLFSPIWPHVVNASSGRHIRVSEPTSRLHDSLENTPSHYSSDFVVHPEQYTYVPHLQRTRCAMLILTGSLFTWRFGCLGKLSRGSWRMRGIAWAGFFRVLWPVLGFHVQSIAVLMIIGSYLLSIS